MKERQVTSAKPPIQGAFDFGCEMANVRAPEKKLYIAFSNPDFSSSKAAKSADSGKAILDVLVAHAKSLSW